MPDLVSVRGECEERGAPDHQNVAHKETQEDIGKESKRKDGNLTNRVSNCFYSPFQLLVVPVDITS